MCPSALWIGMSQMFAQAKLARRPARVKPERALAARNPSGRVENKQTQVVRRGNLKRSVLNDSNRPVRTRMPGGVGGERSGKLAAPIPICARRGPVAAIQ